MIRTIIIAFITGLPMISWGQFPGCPSIDAGTDQNLTCADPCVNLTATPFETGATDTYVVNSIPHTPPIAYDQPGGTPVSVGSDDTYSPAIPLPFTFCFYGQNYTNVVIGSNGAISLGTGDANGYHPYSFGDAIPSTNLTDAGNIFGVYHDVDPTVNGTVNYYILGSAPCRIFVVSYHDLGHFSCNSLRSTYMMVLYETTNAIDVYVEEKETCSGWNSGNAVIGIQNPAGTDGIAAPGRNTGNWTVTTPEGWRFSPDGAPIYQVEWFENGNSIGTGNTVNVCPPVTTTYTAEATYTACDGSIIVVNDDVVVTPDPNTPSANIINISDADCSASNGSFEVDGINGTGPYDYSINNGVNFQPSGQFTNLPAGSYDVLIEDNSGCQGQVTIEIEEDNNLTLDLDSTNVSCFGADDGSVSSSISNGLSPYSYSLNGGAGQASGTFTDLTPGSYEVTVTDDNGCSVSETIEVDEPNELILSLDNTADVSCFGANDGSIETSASGGNTPYGFSINGGTSQGTGDFIGLAEGSYEVIVTDDSGCTDTVSTTISEPAAPTTTISYDQPSFCAQGTETVTINGTQNGSFSSTNGLTLGSISGEINLNNSAPGNYVVTYEFTENGCTFTTTTNVEVLENPTITLDDTLFLCDGETWIVSASGADNFTWSDGLNQGDDVPGVIGVDTFTVVGTNANGCSAEDTIIIVTTPNPVIDASATPIAGVPPLEVTFTNNSTGADDYTWSFGNGNTTNDNSTELFETYSSEGVYQVVLTASTNYGCTNDTTFIITIENLPLNYDLPNVFTPNGDNANDNFTINAQNAESLEIVILNRWGNVVFESTDVNFEWNGNVQNDGNECVDGTYFYKFTITGEGDQEAEEHGFVQLVRDGK